MITVSDNAKSHLLELMKKEGLSLETHNLRVGVKGGGCSGLSYVMDFDDKIDTDSVKIRKKINFFIS